MSTFGLDVELSPGNLALASPAVEKEAMHIANTPLARHPTGAREEDGQEGRQPWSDVVAHRYTSSFSPVSDTPPSRFRVVGIHTPRGGYGKGLFSALSPKEKGEAESIASTPQEGEEAPLASSHHSPRRAVREPPYRNLVPEIQLGWLAKRSGYVFLSSSSRSQVASASLW